MAAAYLRVFTQGKAEVYSAGIHSSSVHPDTIAAMLDDNIDITDVQSNSFHQFSGQTFDYLVTVGEEAEQSKPADIFAERHYHFDIPSPLERPDGSPDIALSAFIKTRESIKREILRFIGKTEAFLLTA